MRRSTPTKQARFSELSGVFGVTTTNVVDTSSLFGTASVQDDPRNPPPTPPENSPFLVSNSNGVALQMDQTSGLYQFTNLNALWTDQSAQAAMSVSAADRELRQRRLYPAPLRRSLPQGVRPLQQ